MTSHLFFLLCLITISGATITRIIRKPHESNNVAQRTITVEKKSISVDREPEPVPIQRDSFDREKVEEQRKLLNHQALVHYTNRDVYKKQREQYRKEQQAQRDRYYDQYFDRMRDYGKNLQRQRYMQMLQKQAQERAEQEKSMNYWGADSGDMRPAETTNSEQSSRPSDPFGSAPSSSGGQRSRSNERSARPLMFSLL